MKIGILTFSAVVNYGAILQTYALKDTLEKLGHDVAVIDYRPEYFKKTYNIILSRPGLRSLKSTEGLRIWRNYFLGWPRRIKRNKEFLRFSNKYLHLVPVESNSHFDVLVCGSDQIWNPSITGGKLDPVFFGLVPTLTSDRKIAYAGSVRSIANLDGFQDEFISLLKQMDVVSAREVNLACQINEWCSDLNVRQVVDPTMLADSSTFDKLIGPPLLTKPYLLFFPLHDDEKQRDYAKKIAKIRNLELVEVSTYHEVIKDGKLFDPVSPAEFCTLVKYSSFVISDSFHATVFSILFDKPFLTLEAYKGIANRITNLLEICKAANRLVLRENVINCSVPDLSICDTNLDKSLLEDKRRDSLIWLKNALEK